MSTLLLSVCDEHVVIVFCSGRAVTTAAIDGWSRCSLVGVVLIRAVLSEEERDTWLREV